MLLYYLCASLKKSFGGFALPKSKKRKNTLTTNFLHKVGFKRYFTEKVKAIFLYILPQTKKRIPTKKYF